MGTASARQGSLARSGATPLGTTPVGAEVTHPVRLAYFGQDRTDSAVIRRIASFQAASVQVLGATFRREKFNRSAQPGWENLDLGTTRDRHYASRVLLLARAVVTLFRARRRLGAADLWMARNLDMALLALLARWMAGSRAPLVYEVLDIHRVFTGQGRLARLARGVERWLLARTALLAVSSPAFLTAYFRPRQGYSGPSMLLENKICTAQLPDAGATSPSPVSRPQPGAPWVIGWFGTLRCRRSLGVLAAVADRMGDRVRIDLRGYPTETGLEPFLAIVNARPSLYYGGEYKSPQDLANLYEGVHLAWCFDFHDADANSRWLLPNRLYDAAYHGVPCLALAGTETGRRIESQGLGWTLEEPLEDSLIRFLERLSAETWSRRRAHIQSLPRTDFCDEEDAPRLIALALGRGRAPSR